MNNTAQQFSQKEDSQDRVYTYIHTYMEKRRREETTTSTNVVFYNKLDLEELQNICLHNKSNVSSVVSNLVREFNLLFKSKTPQKTLFNFDEEFVMDFFHDSKVWETVIRESNDEEKEKIKNQIILIDKILGKYL